VPVEIAYFSSDRSWPWYAPIHDRLGPGIRRPL